MNQNAPNFERSSKKDKLSKQAKQLTKKQEPKHNMKAGRYLVVDICYSGTAVAYRSNTPILEHSLECFTNILTVCIDSKTNSVVSTSDGTSTEATARLAHYQLILAYYLAESVLSGGLYRYFNITPIRAKAIYEGSS